MNLDFSRLIEADILSINQSKIPCVIQSNTNEKLQIKLKEKKELYNLTGCKVKYEIVKPNGSTHEGEVDVTVPTSGFGIIYLTEDVLNFIGVHKINLDIINSNQQIKVKGLKYEVIPNEDNFNNDDLVDSEEDTADKNNIVSEESSDSDTNNSTMVGKDISYINNEVSLIRQHELDIDFDNFSRKSSNASFMLGEMNTSEIIANLKRSNISIDLTRLDVSINIKGKNYDLEKIPCEKLDAVNGKILIKIPNKFVDEVAENSFNVYLQDGERILKSPTFTYKIIDTLQDGIPGDDIELSYLQAKIVEVQQMGDTIEDLKDKFNKTVANVTNGNESATNTEIVLARGDNTTLGERLDSSEEKISVLDNDYRLKLVYDAKCVGGRTEDTIAIQKFIDDLEITGLIKNGGIIQLPPGEIRIDGLIFKAYNYFKSYNNRIIIRGSGIQSTILICDDNSNDIFIDFQGYYDNNGANRRQCANISFQDMKIKCTSSSNKLAFNYNVTQYCDLMNVWIEGFNDGALKFIDAYDSNFYNVNIIECGRANTGTDYASAIGFYRQWQSTNALHFTNCRLEFLPMFIESKSLNSDNAISARHIYFDNCKFEKMAYNLTNKRPFDLKNHNEFGFNNCFFVNSCEYLESEYLCDEGKHFMKIDYDSTSYVTSNNQVQSTKFTNCHFVSPTKTYSNWGSFKACHFVNCDFNSCYGKSDNSECFYLLGENIFDCVNISSQGSKLFLIQNGGNNINIKLLRSLDNLSPIVKLYKGSNYNNLIIDIFSCPSGMLSDYIKTDNQSSFVHAGISGMYYFKNNKVIVKNDTSIKTINSNMPDVYNTDGLIVLTGSNLNYLNKSFNSKIVTVKATTVIEIEHDGSFIYLKDKKNKILNPSDIITFKNVDGVWYEI